MKKRVVLAGIFFLAVSGVCQGATDADTAVSAPYVEIRTSDSAKTLSVYFSLGCFHCVDFLDRGMTWMRENLEKKQLNIRFLEIPGMMPYREGRMEMARRNSALATRYTQCLAAEKGPYAYLEALDRITQLARKHVRLSGQKMDWRWFVYARKNELVGGIPSVEALLAQVLEEAGVDLRSCDEKAFRQYADAAKAYYKTIKSGSDFPVYLFEGKRYLSDQLEGLVGDVATAILMWEAEAAKKKARLLKKQVREEKTSLLLLISQKYLEEGNHEEGLRILRDLANKGWPEAIYRLGVAYGAGSYGLPKDKSESFRLIRKAAERGWPDAQHFLGRMFEKGEGTDASAEQAFAWVKKAAGRGHKAAMYDLYRFYTLGTGTKKDSRQAHVWLRQSVMNGRLKAAFPLGQNYQYGLGTAKDPLQALVWYRVAESAGDKRAAEALRQPGLQALSKKALFRDCSDCPEMVVMPGKTFLMGLYKTDGQYKDKNPDIINRPRHIVNFVDYFAVGRYEITNLEWEACVREQACKALTRPDASTSDNQPRVGVNWDDARDYVTWLIKKTGKPYRLLTESEWEYAARGGMMTDYHWGDSPKKAAANCAGCGSQWDGISTAPVGSFAANSFLVSDAHGNAAEWVQDCLNGSYDGKPPRGKAWEQGQCDQRIVRGGAWNQDLESMRVYERDAYPVDSRKNFIGFRVAVSLQDENRD